MKKEIIRFTVPVLIKYDSKMDRDRAIEASRKNIKFYEHHHGDYTTYTLTPRLVKKKKKK